MTILSPLLSRDGRVPLWRTRFQRVIRLIERSRLFCCSISLPLLPPLSFRRGIAREPSARYAGMGHKRPVLVAPLLPMLMSPLRYRTTRKSPGQRDFPPLQTSTPSLSFLSFSSFFSFVASRSSFSVPSQSSSSLSVDDARPARRLVHNREYRFIARSWNCASLFPLATRS